MTISPELRHAFNYHKARLIAQWRPIPRGNLKPVTTTFSFAALKYARADIANGCNRYTSSPWRKPVTNRRFDRDGSPVQWIEKPSTMGLRFVGYCDDLYTYIEHTGWHTDAFGDESIRGVVYQLPGRNGKARFVAGHDNADNGAADDDGPAFIDWSQIYESDFESEMRSALRTMGKQYHTPERLKPGYWAGAAHETARNEAARGADEFTRVEAEKEREWQTAFTAGTFYHDTMRERAEAKAELRALLVERRTLKAHASAATVAICSAVERQARALLDTMQEAAKKASKLADGEGGEYLSFWPGEKRLQEAFNEGAGESVL